MREELRTDVMACDGVKAAVVEHDRTMAYTIVDQAIRTPGVRSRDMSTST